MTDDTERPDGPSTRSERDPAEPDGPEVDRNAEVGDDEEARASADLRGEDPDAPDEDGLEVEVEAGQLAYDCAAWAGESRRMLSALMDSGAIPHAWQGTTLTIHEEDEERVDDLVDEVLAAARPALDPDAPRIVYEVGEWPVALQTQLGDGLTAADIVYEWDHNGDLVVLEADEEQVAVVLDELPDPDESQVSSDDGVAVHELFDRVFMAADRLVRNGADASGTVGVADTAAVLEQLALPFGFEPADWRRLVGEVQRLRSMLDPESVGTLGEDDDSSIDATDAEIAEQARRVRELLRHYI